MWDYAELSKFAKECGGPEQLVEVLIDSGRKSVYPWLGVAVFAGAALTVGVQNVRMFLLQKREKSKAELEATKKELVQGIKGYDATHTEVLSEEGENEDTEEI